MTHNWRVYSWPLHLVNAYPYGWNDQAKLQGMLSEFIKERNTSTGEKKPSVIDYMGLKKEFVNLEKEAHVWKNKVHFRSTWSS